MKCRLPFLIENMRLRDTPAVATLEEQVFSSPWPERAFRNELRYHGSSEYIVLRYLPWLSQRPDDRLLWRIKRGLGAGKRADRSLLGYAGYWVVGPEAHISTLALDRNWRGLGLGEFLFLSLVQRILSTNASHMALEVREGNEGAQSLYHKYGFSVRGRRGHYYPDNKEDALIMVREEIAADGYAERIEQLEYRLLQRLSHQDGWPPAVEECSREEAEG